MALIGTAALLFVLGLMISPVYTQDLSTQCGDNYTNVISSTNFGLTVSSQNLTANTNYTVTVNGLNDTKTVILRAQSNNSPVGTWQNATGVTNCSLGIAFNANSTTNTTNWTSPGSVNSSVTLSVYILNGTGTNTNVANVTINYVAPTPSSNTTENVTTLCNQNPINATTAGNFTVTVSPQNLVANTSYKVTVNGLNDTKTVILRAQLNNSSVGTWQNATGVTTCDLGIAFSANSTTNTTNWTSPGSVNSSVILSVYILNGTGTNTNVASVTIIYVAPTPSSNTTGNVTTLCNQNPINAFISLK
ncbi:Hypothetical predicted protein [Pelobates cultripes]|uniref:Placenta-expressed transcript 1 protein n=1 Tax=Pelobates cultripes TaxID=61616 RepID=A0AAD1WP52_PELCU|nr:Hypothetical predicted protein [Pelobates cultripes]